MLRLLTLALGAITVMAVAAFMVPSHGPSATEDSSPGTTASAHPAKADPGNGDETEIKRDSSGQFHLGVQVNGEDARFLIDTGADTVALSTDDAQRFGVDFDRNSFEPIVQTASGPGNGARVKLDRIEVAGQEFRDVDAVVIDGLQVNLLGQSVLRKMGKVELRGDRMIIHRDGGA